MLLTQLLRQSRQTPAAADEPRLAHGQQWRLLVLCILLLLAFGCNLFLAHITPTPEASQDSFLACWLLTYLPYLAASMLILMTHPASGPQQKTELAVILVGACLLRIPFLSLSPNLSRDSWRYVWDARVFLHGYSPYVYAPSDKVLVNLRDFLFANTRFRNVPSLYPPGAQYVYVLSYLIVPSSLSFLKGVFLVFDLGSGVVLAKLLVRKGLDPARTLLYAWCPLPVVEFALQGHVDVLPITFTLLAALAASRKTTRGCMLTGFLIGMGTLTKLYPIVMLALVVQWRAFRREWLLILACLGTIVAGYLPFYIVGHGQIFGFFATYANEQGQNSGIIQQLVGQVGWSHHFSLVSTLMLEHLVAFGLLCLLCLSTFLLRQMERISLEAGTLLLFGLVLSVSSHVFPWYATTLLPWIALLLPARGSRLPGSLFVARLLALAAPWLFVYTSVIGYLADWPVYYLAVDDPLIIELLLAGLIALGAVLLPFWQKEPVSLPPA